MLIRSTKLRFFYAFNVVILFCIINFCIYRFLAFPKSNTTPATNANSKSSVNIIRGNGVTGEGSQSLLTANKDTIKGNEPKGNPSLDLKFKQQTFKATLASSKSLKSNSGNATEAVGQKLEEANEKGQNTSILQTCPLIPTKLNGPLATYSHPISFKEIAKANPGLQPGGRSKPTECISRHRVAIVIPYRNREEHLQILLNNLHPMLMRQQLDYGIFVIDQALPTRFNRAMLMNIGYAEAMKRYNYQCAVFHDVDLIPENDRNIYSCPEMPRHLSAAIDKFRYRLPYARIYGGVSSVSKDQFENINGFSNMFFGWGGEDDDMAKRILDSGYKITRYPLEIARYRMIKHTKDKGNEKNPQRYALLKTTSKRMKTDGLNSLNYTVQEVDEQQTHLRIKVFIDEKEILKNFHF